MIDPQTSTLVVCIVFAYSFGFVSRAVNAVRLRQWNHARARLSLEDFRHELEIQYYREKMQDFYDREK